MDSGKAAVSWQSLGFTPRTDRNCGEPGIYIHIKCNTFQTDMKLTGESDLQHLDEHQACNLSGRFPGAMCTDPCTPGLLQSSSRSKLLGAIPMQREAHLTVTLQQDDRYNLNN